MQRFIRGQVWWYKGEETKSIRGIQQGTRPVLIVSNNKGNKHSPIVQIVPCTTAYKPNLPTHFNLYINGRRNTLLCEQVKTIPTDLLFGYITTLDDYEMMKVDDCLKKSLGINKVDIFEDVDMDSLLQPLDIDE